MNFASWWCRSLCHCWRCPPRYFDSLYSTYHRAVMRFDAAARRLVPWQHLTFLPLLCVAKFGESRAQHLQADRTPNTYSLEQAAAGPTLPKCIQICNLWHCPPAPTAITLRRSSGQVLDRYEFAAL